MTDRLAEIRARLEAGERSEELDVLITRWMGIDPSIPLWHTMEWTRNLECALKFAGHLLEEVERLKLEVSNLEHEIDIC